MSDSFSAREVVINGEVTYYMTAYRQYPAAVAYALDRFHDALAKSGDGSLGVTLYSDSGRVLLNAFEGDGVSYAFQVAISDEQIWDDLVAAAEIGNIIDEEAGAIFNAGILAEVVRIASEYFEMIYLYDHDTGTFLLAAPNTPGSHT